MESAFSPTLANLVMAYKKREREHERMSKYNSVPGY
jgi:hypothetical protein